jgi:hypothetical protein
VQKKKYLNNLPITSIISNIIQKNPKKNEKVPFITLEPSQQLSTIPLRIIKKTK